MSTDLTRSELADSFLVMSRRRGWVGGLMWGEVRVCGFVSIKWGDNERKKMCVTIDES